MRRRWAPAGLLVISLVASACSVSTPRKGFVSAGGSNGELAQQDVAGPDGVFEPGEDAVGSSAGAASSSSGGTSTGGSARTSGGTGAPASASGSGTRPNAGATAVGVTKDSITLSFVGDFSGVGRELTNQVFEGGFMTWVDDVNARGGIHGRKVVAKKIDHRDTADGGVAACREVQSNGSFTATVPQGTLGSNATVDCLDRAGIQTLSNAVAASPSWRRAFLYTPTAVVQGRLLASFVKGHMKDGARKIGVIFTNASGMVEYKDSFVASARAAGMNIVGVEAVEPNQASFVPQLTRLRNLGAEHVSLIVILEAIGILRDARALDYAPRWSAGRWTLDVVSTAARDLAKDVQGVKVATTVDQPAFADFKAKQRKYANDSAASSAIEGEVMLGYGLGMILEQALASGGSTLTRDSLYTGTTTITNYDSNIMPPVTFRVDRLDGPRAMFPVICCTPDWKWKWLGPARESFS